MSTKSTIASSDNLHFYHEAFDDDHVYLRLDTTHFEAGYGSVMVRIPIHIWETIRHLAGVEFDLVDKEDDDLLAMVRVMSTNGWRSIKRVCAGQRFAPNS